MRDKLKHPFRVITDWPYSGNVPADVQATRTFREALRRAATSARQMGTAEVTKVVSVEPWRSKRLAECTQTKRTMRPGDPRYGKMRWTTNASCRLTDEGKKLVAASKRARKARQR